MRTPLQIVTTAPAIIPAPGPNLQAHSAASLPAFTVFGLLVQQQKKPDTQRAYRDNVRRFFADLYGSDPKADPDPKLVRCFLALPPAEIAFQLARQSQMLVDLGRSAATVNLRLSAVRALIDLAHKFRNPDGSLMCATDSKNLVKSMKAEAYRDTRGPGMANVHKLLALPDRTTLIGRRDFALLWLLADNGLRRFEICGLQVQHFEMGGRRLSILGKRRDSREWVTLDQDTLDAIQEYLAAAGHRDGALFRNCAVRASVKGMALREDGLDDIMRRYGKQIGLPNLSCHKFRHFAITALLDATGGDMRRVQKFSRHKNLNILGIYDDNREDHQGALSVMLGDLLRGYK